MGAPVVATDAGALAETAPRAPRRGAGRRRRRRWPGASPRRTGDEAVARRLRAAGPEVAGRFTWERRADGLVDLYRRMVA